MQAHIRLISLLLLTLAVSGCGDIDHNDYVDARATAECNRTRTCAQGFFESAYRDLDDCVKERGDQIDDFDDALPRSCDYDGTEGRACIKRINAMSCEEFAEGAIGQACDLVWYCE